MQNRVKATHANGSVDQKAAKPTVQFFVKEIAATWRKSVENIIDTGRLLIRAKQELSHGKFQKMFGDKSSLDDKLPFSLRKAEMLMKIAEHPVISDPKLVSLLPPSWSTLHALTQLPDEILKEELAKGAINSATQREEIKNLNFYLFAAVPKALRTLIEFMRNWPPDKFVEEMVKREDGYFSGDELYELRKLSSWIAELHEGCQREKGEQDARDDEWHAERKRQMKEGRVDARA